MFCSGDCNALENRHQKAGILFLFTFHFNDSSCSCEKQGCLLQDRLCSQCSRWPSARAARPHASVFAAVLYFPLISLGSGTRAGQGTCPSISHMHSRRWYFLGPNVPGCDSFLLSLSSLSSVSLGERRVCYNRKRERQRFISPGPNLQIYGSRLVTFTEVTSKVAFLSVQPAGAVLRWVNSGSFTATYLLLPKIFLMCSVISLLVLSSTSTKTCSPLSVGRDVNSSSSLAAAGGAKTVSRARRERRSAAGNRGRSGERGAGSERGGATPSDRHA